MITDLQILKFFNLNEDCPSEIKNCKELRENYIKDLNTITSFNNCKQCDIIELKKHYFNKLKFNLAPINFNSKLFLKQSDKNFKESIEQTYFFLYPYPMTLYLAKKFMKITFVRGFEQISFLSRNFLFINLFKGFILFFLDKKNIECYLWVCGDKNRKVGFNKERRFKLSKLQFVLYM